MKNNILEKNLIDQIITTKINQFVFSRGHYLLSKVFVSAH